MVVKRVLAGPRKYLIAGGVAALIVAGVLYLLRGASSPEQPSSRRGWDAPAIVRVEPAELGSLNVLIESIGTVTPLNTVTVRSRVDGVLERIVFEEGATVEKGELLAEIDPLPYKAQLEQTEGQLQQNRAKLANARTQLALYETLWEQDSIARQQLSDQRALVDELEGTIRANEAQVTDAKLELSWTRIEAPLSGKLGLRRMDEGNLVNGSDGEGLVTITQMQPIAVNFTVPETEVFALRQAFNTGDALQVEVLDRNEREVIANGKLTTLDNQIDTATGTLRVRARFDNSDLVLFPNQFVNVQLRLNTLESVLTIPADCIQYGTDSSYVYVVEDGKSHVRPVTLGAVSKQVVQITSGLSAGDLVVLEGLDRLRDGKEVIVPAMESSDSTIVGESETAPGAGSEEPDVNSDNKGGGEQRSATGAPA